MNKQRGSGGTSVGSVVTNNAYYGNMGGGYGPPAPGGTPAVNATDLQAVLDFKQAQSADSQRQDLNKIMMDTKANGRLLL